MKLCRLHGKEGSASAANGVLEANKRVFFDGLVDLCIIASINVLPFITTGGCKPRHIFSSLHTNVGQKAGKKACYGFGCLFYGIILYEMTRM